METTVDTIVSIVANNGLAIALCVYYTISFSKQMKDVVTQLTKLTEKIEFVLEKGGKF